MKIHINIPLHFTRISACHLSIGPIPFRRRFLGQTGRLEKFEQTPKRSVVHIRRELSPKAFTLIEILIVLAIIGILAALLLTSVKSVKTSANSAQCAANLRELSAGMLLYTTDHQNTFPVIDSGVGSPERYWMHKLVNGGYLPLERDKNWIWRKLWRCPAEEKIYSSGTSYGLSAHLGGSRGVIYDKPSQVYMFADADDPSLNPWSISKNTPYGKRWIYRHNGPSSGILMAFMDGHVARLEVIEPISRKRNSPGAIAWALPQSILED